MKKIFIVMFFLLVGHSSALAQVRVAADSNLEPCLNELIKQFEGSTGILVVPTLGSTGELATQILNGTYYDVFLAADMNYPQRLYEAGVAYNEPEIYAYGVLVLWTNAHADLNQGLQVLLSPDVKKIAMATPQKSPYGLQSMKAIKQAGIYNQVKSKLLFGADLTQTSQSIISQAAEIGFTAKSVVLGEEGRNKGAWGEVDPKLYQPLRQGAVILQKAETKGNLEQARAFFDFLLSDQAQRIFLQYGYNLPDKANPAHKK